MAVEMQLRNLGNLQEVLRQLPTRVASKHVRQGAVEGIRLIRDHIKRTAPVRGGDSAYTGIKNRNRITVLKRPPPGRLRRLVKARTRRGKRGYQKASLFYPTEGTARDPNNAFYWRFVQDGTKYIAPQPFVTAAADAQFKPAVNKVIRRINTGVREEMAKARKAQVDKL